MREAEMLSNEREENTKKLMLQTQFSQHVMLLGGETLKVPILKSN